MNYVAANFVARLLLAKQPELVAAISKCVAALFDDREGRLLAKQTLDAESKNLQKLQKVAAPVGRVMNEWASAA